jgi:hypothetical protein
MRRSLLLIALAALPAPALAQDKPAAPAPQQTEVVEPTCADMFAALRVAEPGENPSRTRRKEAEQAQDDIATALFWLHGWHYGRGTATLPVTKDWMVAELKRMVEACKAKSPDGAMLISQAATQ